MYLSIACTPFDNAVEQFSLFCFFGFEFSKAALGYASSLTVFCPITSFGILCIEFYYNYRLYNVKTGFHSYNLPVFKNYTMYMFSCLKCILYFQNFTSLLFLNYVTVNLFFYSLTCFSQVCF
jgi:hypothetical protein